MAPARISIDALPGSGVAVKRTLSKSNCPVAAGDFVDFVVDCRETIEHDSFTFAPTLKLADREWSAKTEFAGPAPEKAKPLNAWEKYAQVVLLANELMFVD